MLGKIHLQVMMFNKEKCFHIKASKDKTEVETKMKDRNNRTFGYLYDFWVFVVGQSADENMMQRSKLQYGGLTCRIWNYTSPDSFAFPVCDSSGVFYDVTSSAEEEAGTIFIREKAKIDEHYFCVPWKSEQEIRDVKPITIDSEYRNELIQRSVKTCTLLDKPSRRVVDLKPDYVGCEIPDEFVIGYGLDYDEKYRALPYVGILRRSVYEK